MLNEREGQLNEDTTGRLSEGYEKFLQSTDGIHPLRYKMKMGEAVFSPHATAVNIKVRCERHEVQMTTRSVSSQQSMNTCVNCKSA
jgi:hypothetical protein